MSVDEPTPVQEEVLPTPTTWSELIVYAVVLIFGASLPPILKKAVSWIGVKVMSGFENKLKQGSMGQFMTDENLDFFKNLMKELPGLLDQMKKTQSDRTADYRPAIHYDRAVDDLRKELHARFDELTRAKQ